MQVIAFVVCCWLCARATSWWHVAGLAGAMAVLGNSVYAIVHEAEHGMLHPNRRVNPNSSA